MFDETPFLDVHTHGPVPVSGVLSVYNAGFGELVSLPEDQPVSLGLHPWYLTEDTAPGQLAALEQALRVRRLTALGECGLDRLTGPPLPVQLRVLEQQLELAGTYGVPVILHCVRAFPELISLVKRLKPVAPLIVHGYNANETTARQLLSHSFYLSLGAALLRPGSHAARCLSFIPADRLFLETDNKLIGIEAVYEAAAGILGQPLSGLRQQLMDNFRRVTAL